MVALPAPMSRGFRSVATTRWPTSPTAGRFRASADFEYLWHSSRWRFASSEHRDLFSKDPQHYAPQYDGYCAMGRVAATRRRTRTQSIPMPGPSSMESSTWVHNSYRAGQMARAGQGIHKRAPMRDWHVVEDLPDPVVVGPPCAASPPTTTVALRDGGHWLVIGRQGPRDDGRKPSREGRYGGADLPGRQECRRVPRRRRRDGRGHHVHGQLRHCPCRLRQICRPSGALCRATVAEERHDERAATVEPRTISWRSRRSLRSSERALGRVTWHIAGARLSGRRNLFYAVTSKRKYRVGTCRQRRAVRA